MINKKLNLRNYTWLEKFGYFFLPVLPLFILGLIVPSYANSDSPSIRVVSAPEENNHLSQTNSPPATIKVETIEILAPHPILTSEELASILAPVAKGNLTREELRNVADTVTQLYLNRGFITSRAVIVEDSLTTGKIQIQVLEGELEKIEIEGTDRLASYVRERLQLAATIPLNTNEVEDQLRLLRLDPLFANIEASLRASNSIGKSILKVIVTEAPPVAGSISVDNYSPPSIGSERLNLNFAYRNPTGMGDEFAVSYRPRTANFAGTYRWELNYKTPLNAKNGTLELKTLFDRNEIIQEPFKDFEIEGESELYEINYRQPFIRTPKEELALSLGFTYQTGQTFTFAGPTPFGFGPNSDGVSTTSVLKLSQEYILRSVSGAWALRSQFNFGLDLFEATQNPEPIPEGDFFSWLLQVQRVQVLDDDNFLIVSLDLQLTPDSLLPSQQFVIGGGQSVRGYRQNVLAGDNGLRFSLENRWTIARDENGETMVQLAPFLDAGAVWNVGDNPNEIGSNRNFILALGLGLLWQPVKGFNIRVDYAPPLIGLDNRGNNAQDEGFHFSAGYQFNY